MSNIHDKDSLRKEYMQKREGLFKKGIDSFSADIAEKAITLILAKSIFCLHTFLPAKGKKEVDTWRVIKGIRAKEPDIEIVVPKMVEGTNELNHYTLNEDDLVESKWGIIEPGDHSHLVDPKEIDVVIVPLLAFDVRGYRIGYGKAFYDTFLKKCREDVLTIGVSFFEAEKFVPNEVWDVRLDYCITPKMVYEFHLD